MKQEDYLKRLYDNRFDHKQKNAKRALWKALIDNFLQKYIRRSATVLDIGGGYCEFINQVQAQEKYLIDLNPDASKFADPDVTVLNLDILKIEDQDILINKQFDNIFVSNFFEHLRSKEELVEILIFCFNHLKPKGSLLIIQPNFKYSSKEYYDFIDHQLPITHLALQEVLQAIGFKVDVLIPKFLPFSTKGRPGSPLLLNIYLKLPLAWQLFGGQMFIKASRPL